MTWHGAPAPVPLTTRYVPVCTESLDDATWQLPSIFVSPLPVSGPSRGAAVPKDLH